MKRLIFKKIGMILILCLVSTIIMPVALASDISFPMGKTIADSSKVVFTGKIISTRLERVDSIIYPPATAIPEIPDYNNPGAFVGFFGNYYIYTVEVYDILKGDKSNEKHIVEFWDANSHGEIWANGYLIYACITSYPLYTGETYMFFSTSSDIQNNKVVCKFHEYGESYYGKLNLKSDGYYYISGYLDGSYNNFKISPEDLYKSMGLLAVPTNTPPVDTSSPTPTPTPTSTPPPSFGDIGTHWGKDFINALALKGIMNGYLTGSGQLEYRPDISMKRQEFARIWLVDCHIFQQASISHMKFLQ